MDEAWRQWWAAVCADLDNGAAPGGACWLAVDGEVRVYACHGHATREPAPEPLDLGMWFDLASLTKPIATLSCVMALVDDGLLNLDAPAALHLPELAAAGKGHLTPRHFLTHQSGLPSWVRFYETCETRDEVRRAVLAAPLEYETGTNCTYSDLGFLTLGFLVEAISGRREDDFLRERVMGPLGLAESMHYLPEHAWRCVATEVEEFRGGVVRGVVHDENAWRCDGVAGHAGLFGLAESVGRFGQMVLDGKVYGEQAAAEVYKVRDDVSAERFWLGWTRHDYDVGDATAFGHTGFTGTLLWVSRAKRLVIALLTNRVHPTRDNTEILRARPRWVKAAWEVT